MEVHKSKIIFLLFTWLYVLGNMEIIIISIYELLLIGIICDTWMFIKVAYTYFYDRDKYVNSKKRGNYELIKHIIDIVWYMAYI